MSQIAPWTALLPAQRKPSAGRSGPRAAMSRQVGVSRRHPALRGTTLRSPIDPVVRRTVEVRHCDDVDAVRFHGIQQLVGEAAQYQTADVAAFHGRSEGPSPQAPQGLLDILSETIPQAGNLRLVIMLAVFELRSRLRRKLETHQKFPTTSSAAIPFARPAR